VTYILVGISTTFLILMYFFCCGRRNQNCHTSNPKSPVSWFLVFDPTGYGCHIVPIHRDTRDTDSPFPLFCTIVRILAYNLIVALVDSLKTTLLLAKGGRGGCRLDTRSLFPPKTLLRQNQELIFKLCLYCMVSPTRDINPNFWKCFPRIFQIYSAIEMCGLGCPPENVPIGSAHFSVCAVGG
jgi:hypothetical protein